VVLTGYQEMKINDAQLETIEAALNTRAKILNIQAGAGYKGARADLNEVKIILSTITRQRQSRKSSKNVLDRIMSYLSPQSPVAR